MTKVFRRQSSQKYYGNLKTFEGRRKQVPLTGDKKSSETLIRRLQSEEDRLRAAGVTQQDLDRQRPLSEYIDDYEEYLSSKENSADYVEKTIRRIKALVGDVKTIADLDTGKISSRLRSWRKPPKSLGLTTCNHYMRAVKSFSRWLWTNKKTPDDVLISLRLLNAKTDIRRRRLPFSTEELRRLVEVSPTDRAVLYSLAFYTGLRAAELASLTVSSFDLDRRTVTVAAAYSKHRREDVLPLHGSLIGILRDFLQGKKGKLYPGRWYRRAARMLRVDLDRASIPYEDEEGRVRDFHSLRHSFITALARAGVLPAKAKELARHSTIVLTMDHYTHVETEELRESLDCLPSLE